MTNSVLIFIVFTVIVLIGKLIYDRYYQKSFDKALDNWCDSMGAEENKIITEDQVRSFAKNNAGIKIMCKNCGDVHNALSINKHDANYCSSCKWWICDKCVAAGVKVCSECQFESSRRV